MQETYLITGSAGFIGSNLVRYLMYNHSHKIVGIDKLETTASMHNRYMNKSVDFNIGDVCDASFVNTIFNLTRPNKVIHLAYSDNSNMSKGLQGLENVLKCSQKFDVESFVYLSSSEVYDIKDEGRAKEDRFLNPPTFFGHRKLISEIMIRAYVPSSILRIPEVFGPRQVNGFIPNIIRGLKSLQVGIHGDGATVRDFLYVEDLCSAIDMMVGSPAHNRAFNVSTNTDFTDQEIISMLIDQMASPELTSSVSYYQIENTETSSVQLDASDIKKLGWKPAKKFRERLKFTTSWYKNNQWVLNDKSM
jgi:dTDP-glucose 4,6-dehydratase